MSVRACSASTAARTSASQPSIEKSPSDGPVPAEREREPGPARLARDAIAQRLIGVADRGRAARRRAESPGSTSKPGHPRHARRAREMRPQAQSFRDELLHVGGYPGSRDRLDHEPGHFRAAAPALKEWAAIVHALLEGEQIVDVRKGGLHEDGRHFDVATPALLALADRRAPEGRAAQARVRALGRSRRRVAGRATDHASHGWADIVDVATITEPEHARRARLQAHLGARLRRVAVHVEGARPALGARAARAPARRAAHRRRGTTRTAAARRGSPTTGSRPIPRRCRSSSCSPTSRSRPSTRASARRCPRSAGARTRVRRGFGARRRRGSSGAGGSRGCGPRRASAARSR